MSTTTAGGEHPPEHTMSATRVATRHYVYLLATPLVYMPQSTPAERLEQLIEELSVEEKREVLEYAQEQFGDDSTEKSYSRPVREHDDGGPHSYKDAMHDAGYRSI